MSGLVLGIDTTGRGGAVALATAEGVLGVREHDPARGYAEELFGLFDAVLADCGRSRNDLAAVAVLSGPGSFTGLRIGVMTAKTLALGLGLPLFAAPALPMIAAAAGPGMRRTAIDAGGGHAWTAGFEVRADAVDRAEPFRRVPVAGLPPDVFCVAPLTAGTVIDRLAGYLAQFAASRRAPVVEVDPIALVPEYGAVSQAERLHGLDLSEEIHRPIEPKGWDS